LRLPYKLTRKLVNSV